MKAVLPPSFKTILYAGALLAVAALAPTQAHAQCSSPPGTEGAIIYNSSSAVLQFCGPAGWEAAGQKNINDFVDLNAGLVHHWAFEDNSGAAAIDSVGGADCTFGGSRNTFPGKDGNALFLNNSSANCGLIDAINGKSSFTIATWMRREQDSDEVYIGKGATATTSVAINAWYEGSVYFEIVDSGNGDWQEGSLYIPDTEWYHYVMVFDGTQDGNHERLKTYINGRRVSSSIQGTIPATSAPGLNNLYIDANSGHFDDLRIYNRPLSAHEVFQLYLSVGGDIDPKVSGKGYFVLSEYGVDGNLGGLAGANAYCLSELQENNWVGKNEAINNGLLTSSNVEAWLCASGTCQDGLPFGLYASANMQTPANGGDDIYATLEGYFVKEGSWESIFGESTYFRIYTGRTASQGPSANNCSNFTTASSGVTGMTGTSDTSYLSAKISAFNEGCDRTEHLVCMVHPRPGCNSPSALEGHMIYNADYNVPQYCNGNTWVPMGPVAYAPESAVFNGTTNSLSVSSPSGLANSDKFTASFWVKPEVTGTEEFDVIFNIENGSAVSRFLIALDNGAAVDNGLRTVYLYGDNTSDLRVVEMESAEVVETGVWNHVMISADGATDTGHIYINATDAEDYEDIRPARGNMNFNGSAALTGVFSGGTDRFGGELADVWVDLGTYVDLSVAENRNRFVAANGAPRHLGANGELPTGSAPEFYLNGDTGNWYDNKGSAGGFTPAGTLGESLVSGDGCENPTASVGKIIYNDVANTLQYCNGFGWVAVGK